MQHTDELRALRLLHGAPCMGCIMFILVLIYLDRTNGPSGDREPGVLVVAGLSSLLLIPVSFMVFRGRIGQLQQGSAEPFNALRAALIIHWALIEAAFFFNAVVFLVSGSWFVLGASALALAVLASRAPTEARIIDWISGQG